MSLLPSLLELRSRNVPGTYRRSTWSDLEDLMERMLTGQNYSGYAHRHIPLDVKELKDRYLVHAELPGVSRENISVSLRDKVLGIQVQCEDSIEQTKNGYLCKERHEGAALRTISLPDAGDESGVSAHLEDGVLEIEVKRAEEKDIKRIEVT